MTNEELIRAIKKKEKKGDLMGELFEQNLPLINKICNSYKTTEEVKEDLTQQAFLGIWESVLHFDESMGCKFTSYFPYWVNNYIQQYLSEYTSIITIPKNRKYLIIKLRNFKNEFYKINGREPSEKEIIENLGINQSTYKDLCNYEYNVRSLDETVVNDNDECSLIDLIESDYDMEHDVIEEVYQSEEKNILWTIIDEHTSEIECQVLKLYFIEKKTINQIANELDISYQRVSQIRVSGLSKLRKGKALRKLNEKLYINLNKSFNSSISRYKNHDFTSIVEDITLKKLMLEKNISDLKKACNN